MSLFLVLHVHQFLKHVVYTIHCGVVKCLARTIRPAPQLPDPVSIRASSVAVDRALTAHGLFHP